MLKYLAKISMDIFPSVLATIIGAYIVNHYINARPAADTPAAVSGQALYPSAGLRRADDGQAAHHRLGTLAKPARTSPTSKFRRSWTVITQAIITQLASQQKSVTLGLNYARRRTVQPLLFVGADLVRAKWSKR